jgi:uncharacterized protein YdeI (BOF family)
MKTYYKILLIALFSGIVLAFAGCGKKNPEQHGQQISNRNATRVNEILKEPGNFDGKTVTIQGNIIRECPAGCWLEVKDEAGIIYVDLKPSGFAIPQETGKTAMVEGKVKVRDNQPIIIGTGVEIK